MNWGDSGLTAFCRPGLLDAPTGGRAELERDLALAGSHCLDEPWSAFGEVAGVIIRERDIESVFATVGAACAVDRAMVFDVGIAVRLTPDAPDSRWVLGGTWNLGRPFAN